MSYIPSIDVHFTQFKSASDKLRDLSGQLESVSTEGIDNYVTGLRPVWDEDGTDIFVRRLEMIGSELRKEANAMTKVVDDIEKEALMVFDAEMFSRGLAFSRWF